MKPNPNEDWAMVFQTNQEYEASLVCDILRAADIPAVVMEQGSHIWGVNLGDITRVPVMVPRERLEEAQQLLADSPPSQEELTRLAMQARPPEDAPPDEDG